MNPIPIFFFTQNQDKGTLKMKRFLTMFFVFVFAVIFAVTGLARDLEDIVKPLEQQRLIQQCKYAPDLGQLWKGHALGSAVVTGCVDKVYTGSEITPPCGVFLDGGDTQLTANTDYTTTYTNNTNAGRASVTFKANKVGYYGSLTLYFNILPKPLTTNGVAAISAQTYTGSAIEPTVVVKDGATTLTLNTHYTVEYSNNIEKGSNALCRVIGKGNYGNIIDKFFIIQ